MVTQELKKILVSLEEHIIEFESNKKEQKKIKKDLGIIYTPQNIADFMVTESFKLYFKNNFDFNENNEIFSKNYRFEKKWFKIVLNLKILDPACGSGRFLISMAKILFQIYKNLGLHLPDYDIKKRIIEENLFGIDIDYSAIKISKLRLVKWLLSDLSDNSSLKFENVNHISKKIDLKFNLFVKDFLLEFNINNFDFIIGNPPYIENKKILDKVYKQKLTKTFYSAYRLYDLSILFIEKSLELLKENEGILSFLTINKFLSADYGEKLRELLINEVEIKGIIDISSLPVFHGIAAYPIIISLKKKVPQNSKIMVKKAVDLNLLKKSKSILVNEIPQETIKLFPAKVIPISKNLHLVKMLYTKYKPMSEVIADLNIIYRPYGFIKWAQNFKYVSKKKLSDKDLLLIGTGNVGNFHINFEKPIRIAKHKLNVSYFNYHKNFENIWKKVSIEKLIFREIAKDLTFTYDPGIFTNITGLYFIQIPSYNTDNLFSLLLILNSDLINLVFKTLFSSLHMAGGYLRINGSFIKRLPLPEKFPTLISRLGKILQFLFQFKSDFIERDQFDPPRGIEISFLGKMIRFYKKFSNSLVNGIYLKETDSKELENIIDYVNCLPNIQLKYFVPGYNLPKYVIYRKQEAESIFNLILNIYNDLSTNKKILEQIWQFQKLLLS
ncbi:MAG: Eco57I restriction-modification methylase domain-containing protein [Candidatus Hermodarchaeota archaeon]